MTLRSALLGIGLGLCLAASPAYAGGGGGGGSYTPPPQPSPQSVRTAEQIAQDYVAGIKAAEASEWDKARKLFKAVVNDAPQSADAWNYLGYVTRKGGDAKGGEKAYKKALKLNPNHPGANEYYGQLLIQLGRMEDAKARLTTLKACCVDRAETASLEAAIKNVEAGQPADAQTKAPVQPRY